MKNAVTLLMLSRGVPMLLAGDEIQRTQGGNNNAYNQDNPTSWIDWTMAGVHGEMLRYVRGIIAFRKAHPALSQPYFYTGARNERGLADITWHGTRLNSPGFDDAEARALACTIAGFAGAADVHVMMNMFWEPLTFEIPAHPRRSWRVAVDTFLESPADIADPDNMRPVSDRSRLVQPRSIVVLVSA
jgi:glycogen operon protein